MRLQTPTSSVCKEMMASTRPKPSASTISHAKVGHNRIIHFQRLDLMSFKKWWRTLIKIQYLDCNKGEVLTD